MSRWSKISQDLARLAVASALAQFVGRDREFGFSRAQTLLGCSEGSLKNWLAARTAPQHHEFMQMCCVFGPAFVNAWLGHMKMAGARDVEPGEQCARTMHTAVAKLGAEFAAAMEDGHMDHRERAAILPLVRAVNHKAEKFVHGAAHG